MYRSWPSNLLSLKIEREEGQTKSWDEKIHLKTNAVWNDWRLKVISSLTELQTSRNNKCENCATGRRKRKETSLWNVIQLSLSQANCRTVAPSIYQHQEKSRPTSSRTDKRWLLSGTWRTTDVLILHVLCQEPRQQAGSHLPSSPWYLHRAAA